MPAPLSRRDPGELLDLLTEARARTWLLVTSLSEEDLRLQHDPLMSPIVWDLGHIGHFEDVWLFERLQGTQAQGEGLRGVYNPFENPRSTRDRLHLPGRSELVRILGEIRARVTERLLDGGLDELNEDPLRKEGFVYHLVLQHEYQHNETILQTLQLKKGTPWVPPRVRAFPEAWGRAQELEGVMARFPGALVEIGTDDRSTAYDNERPRHAIQVPAFDIDVAPVSNRAFLRFMDAGGYHERSLWSDAGWEWRCAEDVSAPKYWALEGERWAVRVFEREGPVRPDHPVCHVNYHEAEAYARFVGKRLPTESEWEAAASWNSVASRKERYPWGDAMPTGRVANLDQLAFDTAPVGFFPDGASPCGCEQMIGDVWEWTATDFHGYPGFRSFPYKEYSEVFFGNEYKVLRGGSWATRPGAIRATFRNWDYPIRRQIFSGLRCARDV
ncbi:MAG: ergothioneine biosynthesis protein EgtB [Gemmatimonadota bacterium]